MRPSRHQLRALRWLRDNGGHARPDQWTRMIATNGKRGGSTPGTFLRLCIMGYCASSPIPGHLGITERGLAALRERGL